jgi:hypothetical protein
LPKSKPGPSEDPAKAAADAAYIARAAKAMRWVVRIAFLATVVVLYFTIEPAVRAWWSGDLERWIQQHTAVREQMMADGIDPGPLVPKEWQQWGATVGGGIVMLLLLAGLNAALKRIVRQAPPTK